MLGREEEFKKLKVLLTSSAQFSSILLVGPPKSGKTSLIQEVVKCLPTSETKCAQVSCLSATIRTADIFENVLKQMEGEKAVENNCTSFSDFVNRMIKISSKRMVVVLKNADRLRSLDANLLPGLMKLNELIPNSDVRYAFLVMISCPILTTLKKLGAP